MKGDKDIRGFFWGTWLCRMEPSMSALWICLQDERTISMRSWWLRAPLWKRSTAHNSSTLPNKRAGKTTF